MPHLDIEVHCPVFDSFRVQQVGGMFDVPIAERVSRRFQVEVPEGIVEREQSPRGDGEEECGGHPSADVSPHGVIGSLPVPSWQIGLIVGPSGSGKSTIARAMFGDCVYRPRAWRQDQAVIDGFGPRSIKEITRMLTAVGFSSPPSWIKPYHVLSNGEQFRCDLARSLLGGECNGLHPATHLTSPASRPASPAPRPTFAPLAVFDEFTSVVDRNVARVVSAAIAKGIRGGQIGRRFVAVTCHYDVTEWLTPDWVLDMAAGTFQRRCLRRPAVAVSIVGCRRDAWRLFAPHHYLNGDLPLYSRCFLALWDGVPVAFCATVALIGRKNRRRISRIVTLPDYQGIGIGMAMAETVADLHRQEGLRLNLTCSHPAVIGHCRRSPRWRAVGVKKTGSSTVNTRMEDYRSSSGRAVVSFEYVGKPS